MKQNGKDHRKHATLGDRKAARDRADRRKKREDQRCSLQDPDFEEEDLDQQEENLLDDWTDYTDQGDWWNYGYSSDFDTSCLDYYYMDY